MKPVIVDALAVVGLNVTLQVGGVAQEITVTAETPQLATADAGLGQTIRNEVYTALPLVMNTGGPRDPTAFMFLMPGVQSVGRWGNVMGGQDFTNDTYIEGVPITNAVVQGEGRNLVVRDLGRSRRSVPGRDERHGRDVQRPGRLELRRQVGDELAARECLRVLPQQGARLEGVLRRLQARRQSARVRRHRRRPDSAATACSSSWPTTATAIGGRPSRGWCRFLPLPCGAETSARCRCRSSTRRRRGRIRTAPGFIRDPFPGNIIPANRISAISRNLQSFLPDPTNAGLQNNYLGGIAADRVQQRQRHRRRSTSTMSRAAPAVGALRVRPRAAQRRLSRRHERADGAAAALHRDPARRGDADHGAGQAHLCDQPALGESVQRWASRASACPIANATIDGGYPTQAGLTGLPAGEADSAFPEIALPDRTRRPNGAGPMRARSPNT